MLIASRSKMDVPRFLVCNLAMADFCMGLYLGFLAIVDAATLGEFRKHAISWQFSAGCQVNLHNIPKNQHFLTNFFNISGGRIFGCFELRIERFYASRDYIGT